MICCQRMDRWQVTLRLAGVGWYVGISVLLGVLGGSWLDTKYATKPLWVIVGLVLGLVVAVYGVYQMLLPLIKNKNDTDKEDD